MILILNAGSSSLKAALYDREKELAWCHYDRIGKKTTLVMRNRSRRTMVGVKARNIETALKHLLDLLIEKKFIEDLGDIELVVHRVVHGGEFYDKAVRITDRVLERVEALTLLAPLHNPHNLHCIDIARKLLTVPHVAVFDTAYHQTLPPKAYRYGIPEELYKKYKVRKYGFHGTSHKYLAAEAERLTGAKRIVTCHLGNGSSITANLDGKSVDTSMGFTPTDGLIMGTRVGAIDPEAILYLLRQMHTSPKKLDTFLNQDSGLLGISHFSNDVRDLRKAATTGKGEKRADARLALDMLAYHITSYIGKYHAILGGAEAIVFSGGIGEGAWYIREEALEGLKHLGIMLDKSKNKQTIEPKSAITIHARGSKVKILVIPANEELQMLREARELVQR